MVLQGSLLNAPKVMCLRNPKAHVFRRIIFAAFRLGVTIYIGRYAGNATTNDETYITWI